MKKKHIRSTLSLYHEIRKFHQMTNETPELEFTKDHCLMAVALNWKLHDRKRALQELQESDLRNDLLARAHQLSDNLNRFIHTFLSTRGYL